MTYIGVDPEYRNAANPLDRPGSPSPEALRVLENQALCREVPRTTDWKGNEPEVQQPEIEVELEPEMIEFFHEVEVVEEPEAQSEE